MCSPLVASPRSSRAALALLRIAALRAQMFPAPHTPGILSAAASRSTKRVLVTGCLLAALAMVSATAARAACPPSSAGLLSGSGSISTAAFDSVRATAHVTFDLRAGRLSLTQDVGGVSRTFVEARDAYDVLGVPLGTPVTLTAALDVIGGATNGGCAPDCGGWFRASIRHGSEVAADSVAEPKSGYTPATNPLNETLQLPVTIVAGSPETIEFELWDVVTPGSWGGGFGTGHIHFLNVPPGVTVTSCQGYGSVVTPVRRTSWGALKTIYR